MSEVSVDILRTRVSEAQLHSYQFTLWPLQWATYSGSHQWQLTKLINSEREEIPDGSGVYTLLAMPEVANHPVCSYMMYVGRTVSLRRRFGEYLSKERRPQGRPKIVLFLDMYPDNVWFCYTLVQSSSMHLVESGLRDAYIPPLNDQFTGELGRVVRGLR